MHLLCLTSCFASCSHPARTLPSSLLSSRCPSRFEPLCMYGALDNSQSTHDTGAPPELGSAPRTTTKSEGTWYQPLQPINTEVSRHPLYERASPPIVLHPAVSFATNQPTVAVDVSATASPSISLRNGLGVWHLWLSSGACEFEAHASSVRPARRCTDGVGTARCYASYEPAYAQIRQAPVACSS